MTSEPIFPIIPKITPAGHNNYDFNTLVFEDNSNDIVGNVELIYFHRSEAFRQGKMK